MWADVKPTGGAGAPGIYFFTLDCSSMLPALGAWAIFNLPYRLASIKRGRPQELCGQMDATAAWSFSSTRYRSTAALNVSWAISGTPETDGEVASEAEFFLERYCLYNLGGPFLRGVALPRGASLWRGTITHAPWPVRRAEVRSLEHTLVEDLGGIKITGHPFSKVGSRTPFLYTDDKALTFRNFPQGLPGTLFGGSQGHYLFLGSVRGNNNHWKRVTKITSRDKDF